jgi:hypothetical protein
MADRFECAIQTLLGRQLGAVTFVQDYWQLAFDGPLLTIFTRISVYSGEIHVSIEHRDFRNQICGCIAKVVSSVTFTDGESLMLKFGSGPRIEISLRDCDYVATEGLMFDTGIKSLPLYIL